jgi:regulatory protein
MSSPSRITAIVPTKRDAQRATVKVDGEAFATLSQKRIAEIGLEVHQPWDQALAQRVEAAAAFDKAMMHAMNGLTRRAMSRFEIERKLQQKAHPEPVRQQVLDRLEELSLIDDEAFGRALIRETQRDRPAGPRLLRQKLMQKGLDRALIDQLVSEASDPDDEFNGALAFARKRLQRLKNLPAPKQKRRLYGQLARRGFEPETIDRVMEALHDALTDQSDQHDGANEPNDPNRASSDATEAP